MQDASLMISRADVLMEQGRYKDAEVILRKVLQQDPENDFSLSLLALCYLNTGRLDDGIETIQRAIAIDPSEAHYFYLRAFGEYRKGLYAYANANVQKAINLNPYAAEYFGLQADILIAEKKYEPALEKADEGLAVDPENISCLNARSTALNKLKRTSDAIDTLQAALSFDPNNQITHITAGFNYLEKGKHKEAEEHFMESLRSSPDSIAAKEGLKQALKSKIPPYRWLLQYSYWIEEKGRKYRTIIPIALYVLFRIIIAAFRQNESTTGLAYFFGVLYVFIMVVSWTVNSIANFFLLFHRLGKHALTRSEKITALTAVPVLLTGLILVGSFFLLSGTASEGLFFSGAICISLALPLGRMEYPVQLRDRSAREWYTLLLIAAGILAISAWVFFPSAATTVSVVYLISFVIYTWIGPE